MIVVFTQPIWSYFLLMLFALAVGSFLNVVIHRLPRMMKANFEEECRCLLKLPNKNTSSYNLFFPHSHCPACLAPIRYRDNIPILSYFLLRRRCRSCQKSISLRYPLIEWLTAALTLYAAWHFSFSLTFVFACAFLWILLPIAIIDFDEQIIPDSLNYSLLWLGLLANSYVLFTSLEIAVYSAIAGWLFLWIFIQIFYALTGKIGMGNGDFKLFAAFGAWFGWTLMPFILLFSSFVGAIIGICYLKYSKQSRETPLPFGPFLCISGVISLFWGQDILNYYLSFYA